VGHFVSAIRSTSLWTADLDDVFETVAAIEANWAAAEAQLAAEDVAEFGERYEYSNAQIERRALKLARAENPNL
jgi:hypothetical protein